MLNAGCAHVGPSRAHVEPSWAHLGLMLGQVGPMLSRVGPILGLYWPRWGRGPCRAYVAHVEPPQELCWGHVWAICVETILRCHFFRPGPPPGAQNNVKTDVFKDRQDDIPCRRRARNTVKKTMFLNNASKTHRKLQGLQSR